MQRPGSVTAIAIIEIVLSIIGLVMTILAIVALGAASDLMSGMSSAMIEAGGGGTPEGEEALAALQEAGSTATWLLYVAVAISIISLIGGIMMLKGASWTPFVAIGTWAIKIVLGLIGGSFSIMMLIPVLFVVIYGYLLFQPDAKAYFAGS